jgi:chromosome segregation ATPase
MLENCVENVNAMFMEQYVLFMMQDKLYADGELDKLRKEAIQRLDKEIKELKGKRQLLDGRIQKLKQQNFESYQNYVSGKADSFHSDDIMVKSIENDLATLQETIQEMEAAYIKMECDRDALSVGSEFAVLSKEMIDHYIEKIVVYDEQHIEICWKEKVCVA